MIPVYKLVKLPHSLKLRKISKVCGEIEYRLMSGMDLSVTESEYLASVLELAVQNTAFSSDIVRIIQDAYGILKTGFRSDPSGLLRALNTVRYALLSEIGQFPADWDFIDCTGSLDPCRRRCFPGIYVYLEDIRAPFNVGAMFRTAESFGVEKIFLSPHCADPRHPRAERTARGCVSAIPWERLSSDMGILSLKGPLFALETGGTKLGNFHFPSQGLMIVGSEELGVSPQALTAVNGSLGIVSIPIYGAKGSLNASVAFGIAMQAWAETLIGINYT